MHGFCMGFWMQIRRHTVNGGCHVRAMQRFAQHSNCLSALLGVEGMNWCTDQPYEKACTRLSQETRKTYREWSQVVQASATQEEAQALNSQS